ncbi:protein translocase subunit SecE [Sphaerotilus microaerophilus]|uniref:Protein translocase subunit SecE n=2 Tax=Sphaerotilus microaerophilus TaxID=2914710 RepID=A0ABM7YIN4_9BURK|nr:protein translocase subunit SecE [Sphaerotilus sp. FB-5]
MLKRLQRTVLFVHQVIAMSAPQQVETVSTGADKAKLAAAGVLLLGGLVAFYLLAKQGPYVQWAVLLVLLAASVAAFFAAEQGKSLIAYGRESVRELKKVVWPTRKESLQMTGYVFAFVVVMALFLWLTDKTLEWVLYDLVLGWKR